MRSLLEAPRRLWLWLRQDPITGIAAAWVLLVTAALTGWAGVASLAEHGLVGHRGANVYYDGVHGARHLYSRDNRRLRYGYHTVSGFNRFVKMIEEQGYDLHVEAARGFTRRTLSRYDVFFVGEQTYHSRFMSDDEVAALRDWVEDGGGLFAVVEHTNAHYMGEVFNRLFDGWPVTARYDSIGDLDQPGPSAPTWVPLTTVVEHPVTEGVQEYRFYNGGSLDTPHGVLLSSPSSWSDEHDPDDRPVQNGNKMRDPSERSGPLAGVAAFEQGEGRVVVISDHNALSNPTLYWGDHHRFATNALHWLAGPHLNLGALWLLAALAALAAAASLLRAHGALTVRRWRLGATAALTVVLVLGLAGLARPPTYDLFVHTGHQSTMKINTKTLSGYFSFYGQLTKEPQLRPWASGRALKPGYDALFLAAPTTAYSDEELGLVRGYLRRGRKVVYLASVGSLRSEAGRQLMDEFGFSATFDDALPLKGRRPWKFHGEPPFDEGIFRAYIYKGSVGVTFQGLRTRAWITKGGFHVGEEQWKNRKHRFDVVSTKRVGVGEFVVFAPMDLFDDQALYNLYEPADVVREQMREVVIRLGKYAAGDRSRMPRD